MQALTDRTTLDEVVNGWPIQPWHAPAFDEVDLPTATGLSPPALGGGTGWRRSPADLRCKRFVEDRCSRLSPETITGLLRTDTASDHLFTWLVTHSLISSSPQVFGRSLLLSVPISGHTPAWFLFRLRYWPGLVDRAEFIRQRSLENRRLGSAKNPCNAVRFTTAASSLVADGRMLKLAARQATHCMALG